MRCESNTRRVFSVGLAVLIILSLGKMQDVKGALLAHPPPIKYGGQPILFFSFLSSPASFCSIWRVALIGGLNYASFRTRLSVMRPRFTLVEYSYLYVWEF